MQDTILWEKANQNVFRGTHNIFILAKKVYTQWTRQSSQL